MNNLFEPMTMYMIAGNIFFLGGFVISFLFYQRAKSKKQELAPGTALEYKNLGKRKVKHVPQVVIHSHKKDFYLARIQYRDQRRNSDKLYRLHPSDVGSYFSLAS